MYIKIVVTNKIIKHRKIQEINKLIGLFETVLEFIEYLRLFNSNFYKLTLRKRLNHISIEILKLSH